jgi:VanZ family protein
MKRRLLLLWLPVVLWMSLIWLGSSQQGLPTSESGWLDFVIKKTGHLLEYGILGLLLWRAAHGSLALRGWAGEENAHERAAALLAVVLGAAYAVSDELHQMLVPSRSGNLRDVVIDTLAVTLAVGLLLLWRRRRFPG